MTTIHTVKDLEALYGVPNLASTVKVTREVTAHYRQLIEASPFAVLGTVGPEGLDCSPRGDLPGFVRVVNPVTLHMPDRAGNNRIDSLRNIVRDPRIAVLFMIPGSGTTLRVNGQAVLDCSPPLLDSFAVQGKRPRSVIVMTVDEIFFQCARAIVRSQLWSAQSIAASPLPTPGEILAALSHGEAGGKSYDEQWPERAQSTLW